MEIKFYKNYLFNVTLYSVCPYRATKNSILKELRLLFSQMINNFFGRCCWCKYLSSSKCQQDLSCCRCLHKLLLLSSNKNREANLPMWSSPLNWKVSRIPTSPPPQNNTGHHRWHSAEGPLALMVRAVCCGYLLFCGGYSYARLRSCLWPGIMLLREHYKWRWC